MHESRDETSLMLPNEADVQIIVDGFRCIIVFSGSLTCIRCLLLFSKCSSVTDATCHMMPYTIQDCAIPYDGRLWGMLDWHRVCKKAPPNVFVHLLTCPCLDFRPTTVLHPPFYCPIPTPVSAYCLLRRSTLLDSAAWAFCSNVVLVNK